MEKIYSSPIIEIIEIATENGFAGTRGTPGGGIDDNSNPDW